MSSIFPLNSNTANNNGVNVTTANTQIIADNSSRKALYLTNTGAVGVFLSFIQKTGTAVTNQGIWLAPNGGTGGVEVILWKGAIYGITASGSAVVTYTEFL